MLSLLDVPENFLENMVDYLSITDILSLSRTCKFLNKIYKSDHIWERVFEKYFGLCSEMDYEKLKNIGGFRGICKTICEQLKKNNCSFSEKDSFLFGDIFTNEFHSNLAAHCNLTEKNSSHSNLLIQPGNDLNQDYAASSEHEIESEVEVNSQIYFESSTNVDTCPISSKLICNNDLNDDCSGFPIETSSILDKALIRNRLAYLVRKSERYQCEENSLPGDKTIHYALRYHINDSNQIN